MLRLLIVLPFLFACGSKSKGGDTAPAAPVTGGSFYADTADDLPACTATTKGSLGYAEGEQLFYGCDGEEWTALEGRLNSSVVATYEAVGAGVDFCTDSLGNDSCAFDTARLDVFASGDWFVRIVFIHMYTAPGDSYQDVRDQDIGFYAPAGDTNGAFTPVDRFVWRTDGDGAQLWATLAKSKEQLVFVHDKDNDDKLEGTDTVVGRYDWTLVEE